MSINSHFSPAGLPTAKNTAIGAVDTRAPSEPECQARVGRAAGPEIRKEEEEHSPRYSDDDRVHSFSVLYMATVSCHYRAWANGKLIFADNSHDRKNKIAKY